jgi:sulfopyruvate decarboxylase alpha subunit
MAEDVSAWSGSAWDVLKSQKVRQIGYVPDAGHTAMINRAIADPDVEATVLTTEEEGIGLLAGAWLGGDRGTLLMQSSGVGNCINMLSLTDACRFPLLMLVTMRGEWAEFNPWQIPMSKATGPAFNLMGVKTYRVEVAEDVAETVDAAAGLAFSGDQAVAVLLGQKLIGKKEWTK